MNAPSSTSNDPPSLSIALGMGNDRVFLAFLMSRKEIVSEPFGPTICTSMFHGAVPYHYAYTRQSSFIAYSESIHTHPEFDIHVDLATRAATNALLAPSSVRVTNEVGRGRWMHIKLNRGALDVDFLVVRVTDLVDLERVVPTAVRLHGELATSGGERLGEFPRGLVIPLRAIIHLEGRCTVEYQRRRDADVARAVQTKIKRS